MNCRANGERQRMLQVIEIEAPTERPQKWLEIEQQLYGKVLCVRIVTTEDELILSVESDGE